MPRTKRTSLADKPCAVHDCQNVADRYGLCRTHARELTTYEQRMTFATENMDALFRLGQKHKREALRAARQAGAKIVKRKSFGEMDQDAATLDKPPPV